MLLCATYACAALTFYMSYVSHVSLCASVTGVSCLFVRCLLFVVCVFGRVGRGVVWCGSLWFGVVVVVTSGIVCFRALHEMCRDVVFRLRLVVSSCILVLFRSTWFCSVWEGQRDVLHLSGKAWTTGVSSVGILLFCGFPWNHVRTSLSCGVCT